MGIYNNKKKHVRYLTSSGGRGTVCLITIITIILFTNRVKLTSWFRRAVVCVCVLQNSYRGQRFKERETHRERITTNIQQNRRQRHTYESKKDYRQFESPLFVVFINYIILSLLLLPLTKTIYCYWFKKQILFWLKDLINMILLSFYFDLTPTVCDRARRLLRCARSLD